jgi:hypothetical protein
MGRHFCLLSIGKDEGPEEWTVHTCPYEGLVPPRAFNDICCFFKLGGNMFSKFLLNRYKYIYMYILYDIYSVWYMDRLHI